MNLYRTEITLTESSTLTLTDLPFHAGEIVEVIILTKHLTALPENRYPLRGTPITYVEPLKPVAQSDWETLR